MVQQQLATQRFWQERVCSGFKDMLRLKPCTSLRDHDDGCLHKSRNARRRSTTRRPLPAGKLKSMMIRSGLCLRAFETAVIASNAKDTA